jgi:hypothetical protein
LIDEFLSFLQELRTYPFSFWHSVYRTYRALHFYPCGTGGAHTLR